MNEFAEEGHANTLDEERAYENFEEGDREIVALRIVSILTVTVIMIQQLIYQLT